MSEKMSEKNFFFFYFILLNVKIEQFHFGSWLTFFNYPFWLSDQEMIHYIISISNQPHINCILIVYTHRLTFVWEGLLILITNFYLTFVSEICLQMKNFFSQLFAFFAKKLPADINHGKRKREKETWKSIWLFVTIWGEFGTTRITNGSWSHVNSKPNWYLK